jgi:hypothetical protein
MAKQLPKNTNSAPIGAIRESFNGENVDVMVAIDPYDSKLVLDDLADIAPDDIKTADIRRPISLIYDNGNLLVEDGHHRILHARAVGAKLFAWVTISKAEIYNNIHTDFDKHCDEVLKLIMNQRPTKPE